MSLLRGVQTGWDELEPQVLAFLLRVVLMVGAVVASPFLALALLFFLLDRPFWWWIAVPLIAALLPILAAIVGWFFVRAKLRGARAKIESVARVEDALRARDPTQGDEVVIDTDAGERK